LREKAKDYNCGMAHATIPSTFRGGPRHHFYSLTSIKYHVFDKGAVQMDELLDALKSDFAGRY